MQVRPLATLLLVLCTVSVLARPDCNACNACFMKNAAKDLMDLARGTPVTPTPQGTRSSVESTPASPRNGGEAGEAVGAPGRGSKRTARAATSGWDHDVLSRLRDRERDLLVDNVNVVANAVPGDWWDDSPVEVLDTSAKWPFRERWRESHQGQGHQGRQGAWGDVTAAMSQKRGQSLV